MYYFLSELHVFLGLFYMCMQFLFFQTDKAILDTHQTSKAICFKIKSSANIIPPVFVQGLTALFIIYNEGKLFKHASCHASLESWNNVVLIYTETKQTSRQFIRRFNVVLQSQKNIF